MRSCEGELAALLDAADRVAALEAEVEAVKESESMLDACADVYQERAFAAEQRIADLEAERERHRAIYAACLDDRSALSQRIATLEAELAALKGVNQ